MITKTSRSTFSKLAMMLLLAVMLLSAAMPAFASTPSAIQDNPAVGVLDSAEQVSHLGPIEATPIRLGCWHNGNLYPLGTVLNYTLYDIYGEPIYLKMECKLKFSPDLLRVIPQWVYSSG